MAVQQVSKSPCHIAATTTVPWHIHSRSSRMSCSGTPSTSHAGTATTSCPDAPSMPNTFTSTSWYTGAPPAPYAGTANTSHWKIPWTWCNGKTSSWTWPIPSTNQLRKYVTGIFCPSFQQRHFLHMNLFKLPHLCRFHIHQVQFRKHCIQINLQMYHRTTQLQLVNLYK